MPTEISPWIDRLRPHRLAIGAGVLLVALAVALAWVAWRWGVAEDRMALMQKQADAGLPAGALIHPLRARGPARPRRGVHRRPQLPRACRLLPERTHRPLRALSRDLLREEGTVLLRAEQLVRDSNFDLRLSINSSMLPEGAYLLRVEGYGRGGQMQPVAEARVQVAGM